MALLTILMLVTLSMVNHTEKLYTNTAGKIAAFRESRAAFESLTRRVSQAALNTYFDYVDAQGKTRKEVEDAGGTFTPDKYVRQSELQFVTGQAQDLLKNVPATNGQQRPGHAIFFQAMLGFSSAPSTGDAQLSNLLNAAGYFIEYGSDAAFRPSFLSGITATKNRYRLMQLVQTTESLGIYAQPLTASNRFDWFTTPLKATPSPARPLADNIIAGVLWARRSDQDSAGAAPLTTDYTYDTKGYLASSSTQTGISRNQLPPFMEVTLVALDEASAVRLEAKYGGNAPLLQPGALFTKAPDPSSADASPLDDDMAKLTGFLSAEHFNYRVFSTRVLIRQAKFSKE